VKIQKLEMMTTKKKVNISEERVDEEPKVKKISRLDKLLTS
jgi:hypothetical protein